MKKNQGKVTGNRLNLKSTGELGAAARRNLRATRMLPLLLVLMLPAMVQAQFTYKTNNGAITITGYTGAGGTVVVPDTTNSYPVIAIGAHAFMNCDGVTSVTMGANLVSIGASAFYQCTGLTNVMIGPNVTSIGTDAFSRCTRLPSATIPNSVTTLGRLAFFSCSSLTNVIIGTSVLDIADEAFYQCVKLPRITIPKSVTHIGDWVFWNCAHLSAITVDANNPAYSSVGGVLFDKSQTALLVFPGGKAGSYSIPNSVLSIHEAAFASCTSLTSVDIPNSVTQIGNSAFQNCMSLGNVSIPNSVLSIGDYAFESCSHLVSATISASVTNIGTCAFIACYSLADITVDALNAVYSSVAGVLFDKSQTTLIEVPGGKIGTYTIPGGVTHIERDAFAYCTWLNSVTVPSSVTDIGSSAFYSCSRLTSVYFGGNAPALGQDAFYLAPATLYYLPGTTGWDTLVGTVHAVLWNAQAQTTNPGMSAWTNGFGFNIVGTPNIPIVVEACTSLTRSTWTPLQTCTLTNGSIYFSDPAWTNYPASLYRIRSP
jgi:hypothetical protein